MLSQREGLMVDDGTSCKPRRGHRAGHPPALRRGRKGGGWPAVLVVDVALWSREAAPCVPGECPCGLATKVACSCPGCQPQLFFYRNEDHYDFLAYFCALLGGALGEGRERGPEE
jgi:hypothetical protein